MQYNEIFQEALVQVGKGLCSGEAAKDVENMLDIVLLNLMHTGTNSPFKAELQSKFVFAFTNTYTDRIKNLSEKVNTAMKYIQTELGLD